MTRFARAKGSKGSNQREPEDATPWHVMKQALEARKNGTAESENTQSWHNNFLEESFEDSTNKTQWAEFSDDEKKKKKNGVKKGKVLKKKKEKVKDFSKKAAQFIDSIDNLEKSGRKLHKKKNRKTKDSQISDEQNGQKAEEYSKPKENKASNSDSNTNVIKKSKKKKFKENKVSQENNSEKRSKFDKESNIQKNKFEKTSNKKFTLQKNKKIKDNKKHERRKPKTEECVIGGKNITLMYIDGFPVKKEDGDRLIQLRKDMINKGIPRSEIEKAMKLERRRAEKALAREKKKRCFNCRGIGHVLSECPNVNEEELESTTSGICFKCGSTEHTHFQCRVVRDDAYKFAQCFICKEQGHIARQCPDNAKGLYPQGGACKLCGDVTHLKKDCPKYVVEQEENRILADTIDNKNIESLGERNDNNIVKNNVKKQKVIKF